MGWKTNTAIGVACGLFAAAGGALGSRLQMDHDAKQKPGIATAAFVRGACGSTIESCSGSVVVNHSDSGVSESFDIARGGAYMTDGSTPNPVPLPGVCTGVSVYEGEPMSGSCQFIRPETPQQ